MDTKAHEGAAEQETPQDAGSSAQEEAPNAQADGDGGTTAAEPEKTE